MQVLLLLLLFRSIQACESDHSSATLFVTSTSTPELHTGTQSDPFTGLDQALVATRNRNQVWLLLSDPEEVFYLNSNWEVANELQISAETLQDLDFVANVRVLLNGSLTLVNVKLRVANPVKVEGKLKMCGCLVVSCPGPIAMLYSGYFGVKRSIFMGNEGAVAEVLGWNSSVELTDIEVREQVGAFILIAPATGSGILQLNVTQSKILWCKPRNVESLFDIKLAGNSQSTGGNVTITSTEFSYNSVPLLSFDIQGAFIKLSGLNFDSNSDTGLQIVQSSSHFHWSDSVWRGNQGAMVLVTSLVGDITISNLTISAQHGLGLIHVTNPGDFSSCAVLFQNSTVSDAFYYHPSKTFGIVAAYSCTVLLRNLHVEDYIQLALTIEHLRALFTVENGAMSVENLYSNHSGTTAYYLTSINSALLLSNFTVLRNYVGAYLVVGQVFGQLRIHSAVFGDVNISESDSIKAIDGAFRAPVFVGWTFAEIEIRSVKFVDQVYWRYALLFVSSYSSFSIQEVWTKDLVLDSVIALTESEGEITDLAMRNSLIRLFLIQLFGKSSLTVRNFYVNSRTMGWGAFLDGIFVVSALSELYSYDMVLDNCTSKALMYAKRGTVHCWNLTIQGGQLQTLVGSAIDSSISLVNLRVLSCKTAIAQAFKTSISIVDSQFIEVTDIDKLVMLFNSTILFRRTVFRDIQSNSVFGKLRERSSLTMENCSWVNVGTKTQSTNWLVSDGVVVIQDSHFNFISSALLQARLSDISLLRSTFKNVANHVVSTKSEWAYGGVVGCVDCRSMRIEDVYVLNVSAAVGGAVSMVSRGGAGKMHLRNGTFVLCTAAYMGGAVYLSDVAFEIRNSLFRFNYANNSGGALDVSVQSTQTRIILNSQFLGNKAAEGGAIKWRDAQPTVNNVTFDKNQAYYGPSQASYGIKLALLTHFPSEGEVSGQRVALSFEMLDHANTRVTTASNEVLRLLPNSHATYAGNSVSLCKEGIFLFTGLSILTLPASAPSFQVAVERTAFPFNDSITIPFRNCTAGEIYRFNKCEYCNPGNVSYWPDDPACAPCPRGATCFGGSNMTVNAGYWRSSPNRAKVFTCPIEEKCLGGVQSACAEGYTGKLCSECKNNFYRVGVFGCLQCSSTAELWMELLPIPVLLLFYLCLVVRFVHRSDEFRLYLLKTIVHHAQLLSLMTPFKVAFPPLIFHALQGLAYVSSLKLLNLPIACLGYDNSELVKAVIGGLLVPLLTACCMLFALLHRQEYKRVVSVSVTSVLLFTPAVSLQVLVPMLACQQVDSTEKWLVTDMSVQCWEDSHSIVVYYAVPAVLLSLSPLLVMAVVRGCSSRAFEQYFPLWCAGNQIKVWDAVHVICKCSCLWLAFNSIADAKLGQITYVIIGLIVYSVTIVAFETHSFQHKFYFALSEVSILIVTISVGIGSFYIFISPDEGIKDLLFSLLIYVLNGSFFVVCLGLMLIGPGKLIRKHVAVREVYQESLQVPNNSFI